MRPCRSSDLVEDDETCSDVPPIPGEVRLLYTVSQSSWHDDGNFRKLSRGRLESF